MVYSNTCNLLFSHSLSEVILVSLALFAHLPSSNGNLGLFPRTLVKRRPIPQRKQKLHEHEQRGQQEGLEDVVEEGGCAVLEEVVAGELGGPGEGLDGGGDGEGGGGFAAEYIGAVRHNQQKWSIYCLEGIINDFLSFNAYPSYRL